MKYTIYIVYQTGDSNGSERTADDISITWKNLDVAKTALERIRVHDEAYRKMNNYMASPKTQKAFTKVPGYTGEYSISLPLDDGSEHNIHTFWHGYFERLIEARIVFIGEEGLEYVPKYY